MKLFKYNTVIISLFILSINLVFSEQMADANQPKVSIHAEDTYLPTILSRLAKQSGYNIVTGPNVQTQEKLTIHLDNVPISQALNLIIRASGLSYEIIGNSILVANKSKLNADIGIKPHVINLNYANADEVAKLLQNISATITIDRAGNNILVNASPKKIDEIETIIKEVDKPAIQVMLEARLIEISLVDKEEMGIDWERLASTSIIFAESGVTQQLTGNLLTGSALPGYSWALTDYDGDGISDFPFENIEGQPYGQMPTEMAFTRESGIQPFGRQLTAFDVTLDMLLKDNRANILTNSQVVTLNGHSATIDMVDEIPYLASSGGIGGTMQVLKEIVGIRLNILPTVNSDGYITTKVTPEVSSIQEWTAQGYPWTKKRQSQTTIRVKDGETIVIAGLVTTEKINSDSKFPILWRIPWIGKRFFTHTMEEDKKTDLVIQVKPTIVKDNYSGIVKQYYHEDAEKRLIVADPSKMDSTLIDSSLIK
tara:strand:+ start:343 stop:1791 length:1449 start_codon:yes stop_codon:yes gene_type:complete